MLDEIFVNLLENGESALYAIVVIAVSLLAAVLAILLYRLISKGLFDRIRSPFWKSVNARTRQPMGLLLLASSILVTVGFFELPSPFSGYLGETGRVLLMAAFTWFAMRSFSILEDSVLARYRIDVPDNLKARKVFTQLQMIRRLGSAVTFVVGLCIILISFEEVREIGATLLASAGVIGVVIGFAGQRTIATVISGLQVAFTQPIRIDDAVLVENEWGRVEEITMTYVVVRIWDQRRLVLPISYFIEKPFQNWTRVTTELLGSVMLFVDYRLSVEGIRKAFHEMLKASPRWDGRVWNVQVTNANETAMELRFLMSSADSSTLWDLRVEMREKLIAWIARRHPDMLPRARVILKRSGSGSPKPPKTP